MQTRCQEQRNYLLVLLTCVVIGNVVLNGFIRRHYKSKNFFIL